MPLELIFLLILISGFFRSLQLTCINALMFADVPPALMSRATSMSAVIQQLSLSLGISIGAMALAYTTGHDTTGITAEDFTLPFGVIALFAAASILIFARLAPDAGEEVSGRQRQIVAKPTTEPG
jgi:hypothetical protein